jgi:Predicted ATPase
MRITEINLSEDRLDNGIKSIHMQKLDQIVILAGKNGSGKTRILNNLKSVLKHKPTKEQVESYNESIKIWQQSLNSNKQNINSNKEQLTRIKHNIDQRNLLKSNIATSENNITSLNNAIKQHQDRIAWDLIITDSLSSTYKIIEFVPKTLKLENQNSFNKQALIDYAQGVHAIGMSNLSGGTLAKIQVTQDNWFNATHQLSTLPETERIEIVNEYESLKKLIKIFLDSEIDRDKNGEPTMFGFPISKVNLSNGQRILIQFCLAIHCQGTSLNDLILFMDEPENHLHPSAIINIIEKVREHSPNGQIWIATHSIPLLAHFDPNFIWYVENGKISHAGQIPEKVLHSLLGEDEEIARLQDFISLPGVFALNRHAFESLFHPPVVNTGKNDPQTLQVREEIKNHQKDKGKIRILDFGAGKGRLLSNILENNTEPKEDFIKWFDYIAYDKFEGNKQACLSIIQTIYPEGDRRYFNEYSKILEVYDKGSFDVVIMCNVLHEIDPKEWLKLFGKKGSITDLLSENGILLLVEDQQMPIGEKAYQKGFIVLDTADLRQLFSITESDADFSFNDARNDGRLKAHRIRKEYLERITDETRKRALQSIHDSAKEKILDIREKEVNYKNGKIHGFWIQQLANTALALAELQ